MTSKRPVTIRLPADVRRWLRHESAEAEVPVCTLVERAVREAMSAEEVSR